MAHKIAPTLWVRALGLPVLLLFFTPTLRASALDSFLIGMFPENTRDLGYADLDQARELSWFPQLESQLLPVPLYGFERFLAVAEMRQTSPVDAVAWARIPASRDPADNATGGAGELVGLALGQFEQVPGFVASQKLSSVVVGDSILYSSGTGSATADVFFTVIDPNTIAFGPLAALKRMLGVRSGLENNLLSNEKMMALIAEVNGTGMFWGVFDSVGASAAVAQLVPAAAAFPQAQDLISKMKGLLVRVSIPSDIEIDLETAAPSQNDVVLLSQLLQAALLYQSAEQTSPKGELNELMRDLRIVPNGNLLDLKVDLTNDQVLTLIQQDRFILLR